MEVGGHRVGRGRERECLREQKGVLLQSQLRTHPASPVDKELLSSIVERGLRCDTRLRAD